MIRSRQIFFLFALTLLLILPTLLRAQENLTDVSVTGRVLDPTGAAVPHAQVNILDPHGAKVQTTVTDQGGQFVFRSLSPGNYVVQVEANSFQTATVNVEIAEGVLMQPLAISLKLQQVKAQVTVTGRDESLTVPDAAVAQEQLDTVPGNVSEITADEYRGGEILSMNDALSLTPGVFAEPNEGTQEVTLSIRGSGMNVPYGVRGVSLLQDGIPVSLADGYSNVEEVNPFNDAYIEVYRGADGLEFGAATLGGRN